MLVIFFNCVTLGMYQPCVDEVCHTNRCKILQMFDDLIFAFFALEMAIKMVAMGVYGKLTYLADPWNKLDFFIVLTGALEYCLNVENLNLTAIRTIRVLRPLKAINRIPSMRILVMLLLDTLPMLGNVLLLCFFVFFVFGIIGVQMWEGTLRQRCELALPPNVYRPNISFYYEFSKELDYICSTAEDSGMHQCKDFPPYRHSTLACNSTALPFSYNHPTNSSCVNWNIYYTNCTQRGSNPFQGTISFDNIGLAWVAIFLVISLEGWSDIMYYVQDAHSFWDWIYFVLLIVIGSFFMINLCLVVIATQFAETKKREMERMRVERARFHSSSTLASSTNISEPTTCYAEIVKYIAHLWRRYKRRLLKKIKIYKQKRSQLKAKHNDTLSPNTKTRQHHPCCPKIKLMHTNYMAAGHYGVDAAVATVDDTSDVESPSSPRRRSQMRVPSISVADIENQSNIMLLSPPSANKRKSPVMFSDVVLLHGSDSEGSQPAPARSAPSASAVGVEPHNGEKNICSREKMTQTGDDDIWPLTSGAGTMGSSVPPLQSMAAKCSVMGASGADMSCQELLVLSGTLSAALPTGEIALDSFFHSLTKDINKRSNAVLEKSNEQQEQPAEVEDFSCCGDLQHCETALIKVHTEKSGTYLVAENFFNIINTACSCARKFIKKIVAHKYFQQGILLAILINTLSMGIEYHNQPEELTVIVETSNIVFSAVFAVEMILKVVAEGPFKYISNGFNVFDGIIVILSAFELAQTFIVGSEAAGSSGISVLRTFRLLRILKLVRFMPNLRRQLFVMLRTMDNVAVFFSLLVLFIFIFSVLGMYVFGGKFCKYTEENGDERECTCQEIVGQHPYCECDRKHFNNFLWATVTVFQVLTQEDWNIVLFNGMAKTSHWAALYFVVLMTFGNYVLFNLLVAILVEGFSSERNERREREQRELAKSKLSGDIFSDNNELSFNDSLTRSESSDSCSQRDMKNWCSADDVRKINDYNPRGDSIKQHRHGYNRISKTCCNHKGHDRCKDFIGETKCNVQKESKMTQNASIPVIMTTAATPQDSPNTTIGSDSSLKEFNYSYNLSHSSLFGSLDSIDKSSCTSIPGLLKVPNAYNLTLHSKMAQHNIPARIKVADKAKLPVPSRKGSSGLDPLTLNKDSLGVSSDRLPSNAKYINSQYDKNIQLSKSSLHKESSKPSLIISNKPSIISDFNANNSDVKPSNNEKFKINRGYSLKISRPSVKRKNFKEKHRSGSDSDAVIILNNGRKHSTSNGSGLLKNGIRENDFLLPTNIIKNDTQSGQPNNMKSLSPQNSFKTPSPQNTARKGSGYSIMSHVSWPGEYHHERKDSNPPINWQTTNHLRKPINPIRRVTNKMPTADVLTVSMHPTIEEIDSSKKPNELKIPTCQSDVSVSLKSTNIASVKLKPPTDKSTNVIPQQTLKEIKEDINQQLTTMHEERTRRMSLKTFYRIFEPKECMKQREEYSLYLFSPDNKFRRFCKWFVERKWFDNVILLFIALNCITLAMERPNIPPYSKERAFLSSANYVFTEVFAVEMFVKVVSAGMFYGPDAYFTSGWNIMDGSLVIISIIDLLMSLLSDSSPRIFGILRVFRLLRSLRPLRVINRAPGLKLVVQTLLSSLRPIGNIVLICCTFFIIFGILGVQLFKGTFYYCEGENVKGVRNRTECLAIDGNDWINRKYNFDDLGKALMSLFVLSSRDGWVNIMYSGLDAVGVDQQPVVNYSEWRLLYFIAFILLVGFFVLNMFVGVVVENFHRCREEQEKEERVRRAAKRALQLEKKRRQMHEPPYYSNYSHSRLFIHNFVTSKYFDLSVAGVIGLNIFSMAVEYYRMPSALEYALKLFNYFFTAVFILEAAMKVVALGFKIYLKDKWNQLDVAIVLLSIAGIVLEELQTNIIPINPTIMRVMRVLRIARVLKLLKMAKGIRALLDTVIQALPQVGNLGLLFFLLFFIFAALGVELFGRLECSDEIPCQGLGEHAHFANFGMAFLTLFRVATGDNWNGIMKDTLREECDSTVDCVRNCCVSNILAPIFFVIFVLMAQFVLVNVVVAVLMKHLEESQNQLEDEFIMEVELKRELIREQEDQEDQALLYMALDEEKDKASRRLLTKVLSLPANFTYSAPPGSCVIPMYDSSPLLQRSPLLAASAQFRSNINQRRQTLHSQHSLMLPIPMSASPLLAGRGDSSPGRRRSCASVVSSRKMSLDRGSGGSRGFLSRESSTESYRRKRLQEGDRSVSCTAATNVLYEEEPCYIDEDEKETPTEREKPQLHIVSADVCSHRKDSIRKNRRPSGGGSSGEETRLLPPDESSENKSSFLSVAKFSRTDRKMFGSTKHLFKQPAIDDDSIEEASLLLPPTEVRTIESSLPFLKVEIPPSRNTLEVQKESANSIRMQEFVPQSIITIPSKITVTESDLNAVEIVGDDKLKRRKGEKINFTETTKILIESRTQSIDEEGSSGVASMPSQGRSNRHLSADRMSAAAFSTSGESDEFLLGQRSLESYEETSDELAMTNDSASTAVVEKTSSINDTDDVECLITVTVECDNKQDPAKKGTEC